MTKNEIIERTACGLRRMQEKPDYFVLRDDIEPDAWDVFEICGVKTLHINAYMAYQYDNDEIGVIPAFANKEVYVEYDVAFRRGYYEGV
jgi:hypothetical protein